MSELIDGNSDLMAALASLGQHPSPLSNGSHGGNGLVDPALPPAPQPSMMDQHLLGPHGHLQPTYLSYKSAHLQRTHLQHLQQQQQQQQQFYGPSDSSIQFDSAQQQNAFQQNLVSGGGGSVFASPPLGGLGGHGLQGSHSPSQVAHHLDPAAYQQQPQHHDVDIYADAHAGPSSVGGQQPTYYDGQLVGGELKSPHDASHLLAPVSATPAPPTRSSKKKKKKVRPPPDPNAPPPPPKRPKPLPKKELPPPPPGSENGESDGAAAGLGKPLVMPTHKEVHAIIDERYKTLKRLFTKKAGLTGGPGRPPTKPQPSIAPEIVRLHEIFPTSPVLPYLTAEVTLEKPKTLLSFLGGSKTTKLSRSSSTATWYVWSLRELRSVRDGLAELHLLDEGTAWARLDDEQRAKLEAVELDLEDVLHKVEEGMLKVFDGVVEAREDDPEPGEEPVQTGLESLPGNGQLSEYARLGAYAENLYIQQVYEKASEDDNAVASSSKVQMHTGPPPSLAELRQMYPGSAILPHLLANLALKTAKVMVNFLSGAGVTKRTPDEKTRSWYTKNITSYRHMSLALAEMRGHKTTWDGLALGLRRRLEMLEGEVSERLVKLKEGRFEVFGISDDDDEMKGRAEDEAHDEGDDDDDPHGGNGSGGGDHSHLLLHHDQGGQQLDQSHLHQQHNEQYASLGDDPGASDGVDGSYPHPLDHEHHHGLEHDVGQLHSGLIDPYSDGVVDVGQHSLP